MSDEPEYGLTAREAALEAIEPAAYALGAEEMPLLHPQDYARLSIAISLKRAVDLLAGLVEESRAEEAAHRARMDAMVRAQRQYAEEGRSDG